MKQTTNSKTKLIIYTLFMLMLGVFLTYGFIYKFPVLFKETITKLEKDVTTEQELESKIKNKPDIMKIAEQWSLFLTDDLSGQKHGFNNISQYLIKDSDLYKYAKSWATGIDITFVTSHTLENPTFTNKSISSIEIYSEDAFSAEVYLQKNLRLRTGKKIEDKMHERMYFANYKDENGNKSWKLVNMQSIVDNK